MVFNTCNKGEGGLARENWEWKRCYRGTERWCRRTKVGRTYFAGLRAMGAFLDGFPATEMSAQARKFSWGPQPKAEGPPPSSQLPQLLPAWKERVRRTE